MIVKEYYQNINTHKPRDYFEKWYADVWKRRVGKPTAAPGFIEHAMVEELKQIGAELSHKDNGYRFVVTYHNDAAYTMFVMRWS